MKRVVILLAIVVVLYLVTVGLGVSQGEGDRDVESLSQSWVGALDSLTAWFAPELELAGIKCSNQPVSQIFRLTEAAPSCDLALPRDDDEDYRHAELSVVATGNAPAPDVFIKGRFTDENRPDSCRSTSPQSAFWLEVTYDPNGDNPEGQICWLPHDRKKPVSVTVLTDGGTLTLTCTGCDTDTRREVVLRMR